MLAFKAAVLLSLCGAVSAGCGDPAADRFLAGDGSLSTDHANRCIIGFNADGERVLDDTSPADCIGYNPALPSDEVDTCEYTQLCRLTSTVDTETTTSHGGWPRGEGTPAECGVSYGTCSDPSLTDRTSCEQLQEVWTPGWSEHQLPALPANMPCFFRQYAEHSNGPRSPTSVDPDPPFFASCASPRPGCDAYQRVSDCLLTVSRNHPHGLSDLCDSEVSDSLGLASPSQINYDRNPICTPGDTCSTSTVGIGNQAADYPFQLYSNAAYIGYLFHVSQSGNYRVDLKYRLDTVTPEQVPVLFKVNGAMFFADPSCYDDIAGWLSGTPCPVVPAPYEREQGVMVEQTRHLQLLPADQITTDVTLRLDGVPLQYYDNEIRVIMTQSNQLDLIEINVHECMEPTSCSSRPCFEFPPGASNAGSMLFCDHTPPADRTVTDSTCDLDATRCSEQSERPYCCQMCSSMPGWGPPGDGCDFGTDCVDINECEEDTHGCQDDRPCVNTPGSFYCGSCPDGSSARGDSNCINLNECGANKCGEMRECDDFDTSSPRETCTGPDDCTVQITPLDPSCAPDCPSVTYRIGGDGDGDEEAFPSAATHGVGPLEPPLGETGTLPVYFSESGQAKYACLGCSVGYQPRLGANGQFEQDCVDIDECADNNGGCVAESTCFNTPGSNFCGDCPSGYQGNPREACTLIPEDQVAEVEGGGVPDDHVGKWWFISIMVILSGALATVAILCGFKQIIDSHEIKMTEVVRGKGNEVRWDKKSFLAS